MYVPLDVRRKIHPPDDDFLDLKKWDFANTPPDRYLLLLYYHLLVIYRHQVIKQADVVLVMLLLGHEFSLEQKKPNFDYYDQLTTGDSSLSACIQSIVAFEIGYDELALRYLINALLMDLADVGGNVKAGCHIASMGGTLLLIARGDRREIRNTGDGLLRTLNVYVPPAYTGDGEELPRSRNKAVAPGGW
jgi:alpha,alpha-trehalose phosphorylase